MAGLITKLSPPGAVDLTKLLIHPSTNLDDFEAAARNNQRAFRYAMSGMLCGTFALLTCLGSYAYLVMHAHLVIAGMVLATQVLAIIGDIIWVYLSRQRMPRGR